MAIAAAGRAAPPGGPPLLGGDFTEEGPDGGGGGPPGNTQDGSPGADTNPPPTPDGGADTTPPAPDACATPPANKPGFEGNLCNGAVCNPGDNSGPLDSGLCTQTGSQITCTVPSFDAGPPPEAGPDTGPPDADQPDTAPPPDAGPPLYPNCRDIAGSVRAVVGNPSFTYPTSFIYAIGSTAIEPYVGQIAQQYAKGVSDGFSTTVIYVKTGSCVGVEAAYVPSGAKEPMVVAMKNQSVATVMSAGHPVYVGTYFDPAASQSTGFAQEYPCQIDPSDPTDSALLADVGFSDVFPGSCTALPASWGPLTEPLPNPAFADFFGPVQVMEMVVPTNSSATSITYEQAELVWGYGAAAGVSPWTDTSYLFKRSAGSGTQTMIARAIGLDPRVWKGVTNSGNGNVLAELQNVAAHKLPDGGAFPEAGADASGAVSEAIGILSSDFTDDNAQVVRPLAFQDQGESCAWLPDSNPGSFDKRNVRDGHYPIWGPSHMIAAQSGGQPLSSIVLRVYEALNGQDPALASTLDVIKLYATHHIVPTCAMHVTRSSDGADYTAYHPGGRTACSCYYDSVVPLDHPDADCTQCSSDADCKDPARVCNIFSGTNGFCEIKGP
jgi:hypothetical protein